MRIRRRRGAAAVIAALAGVCALAGCGNSHSAANGQSTTSLTSSPAASSATTTSSASSAVLNAYRASWTAFEQALAGANPNDPTLAATMVDPQLQGVKANLLSDQVHGMIGRGTFTLHPKITSLTATTAMVVDCAYSTAELVYKATGKPVPPITPPENDGVSSTLLLTGGVWKVYKQTVTDGSCAPGA